MYYVYIIIFSFHKQIVSKKVEICELVFTWSNLFLLYLGNLGNWALHHFRIKAVDLDPMVCSHRQWAVRILQFVTPTLMHLFKVNSRTHDVHTCCRAFGSRAFTTCSCFIKLHLSRSGFEHGLHVLRRLFWCLLRIFQQTLTHLKKLNNHIKCFRMTLM